MKNKTKHILDFVMSVMLLFLMAYQVAGEKVHEWLGIATTQEHVLPAALGCCTKLDKGYMLHTLKKKYISDLMVMYQMRELEKLRVFLLGALP